MKVLPVLLLLAYPILVHAGVLLDAPRLIFLSLLCLVGFTLFRPLSAGRAWAWLALIGIGGVLYLLSRSANGSLYAAYLPSLAIPAMLAGVFGATLLPGRQPLIEGMARHERGGVLPDDLVTYTRRLTQLWTAVFVLMFGSALLLILLDRRELWSLMTNVVNYLVAGAIFPIEYVYRRWRFSHHHHPSFIEHIRLVARNRRGQA
ncbi:MAG TPA: hypothetical protein VM369_11325 [Candidatus Binatia bacterium]|nr:hypothetical protein [Candidatus Binatia bacterium]